MTSFILGFTFVVITTVSAVVGMLYVRRKVGVSKLREYHEVAGYLLSIIGTLYAVLLGFVVVDTMQHVQDLRVLVEQEANGIANIYLCSKVFEEKDRDEIRNLSHNLVLAVVDDEWPAMQQGKFSPKAFQSAYVLWNRILSVEPKTELQKNAQAQIISEMCRTAESRRTRLISAKMGVQPILWVVLIIGGLFTVLFTYFFGVESVKAQIIMTTLVALTLALNMLLVFIFGSPFTGDMAVRPDAFKLNLKIYEKVKQLDAHQEVDWSK
ncbi:MAG: DUF4239 domain-containing protein [Cyanobacteria bacterium TGS_CYA1]|nr:DUF4239 domain-containing protein [Cyanobacteria bacterium TGS_CYA1]